MERYHVVDVEGVPCISLNAPCTDPACPFPHRYVLSEQKSRERQEAVEALNEIQATFEAGMQRVIDGLKGFLQS